MMDDIKSRRMFSDQIRAIEKRLVTGETYYIDTHTVRQVIMGAIGLVYKVGDIRERNNNVKPHVYSWLTKEEEDQVEQYLRAIVNNYLELSIDFTYNRIAEGIINFSVSRVPQRKTTERTLVYNTINNIKNNGKYFYIGYTLNRAGDGYDTQIETGKQAIVIDSTKDGAVSIISVSDLINTKTLWYFLGICASSWDKIASDIAVLRLAGYISIAFILLSLIAEMAGDKLQFVKFTGKNIYVPKQEITIYLRLLGTKDEITKLLPVYEPKQVF